MINVNLIRLLRSRDAEEKNELYLQIAIDNNNNKQRSFKIMTCILYTQ